MLSDNNNEKDEDNSRNHPDIVVNRKILLTSIIAVSCMSIISLILVNAVMFSHSSPAAKINKHMVLSLSSQQLQTKLVEWKKAGITPLIRYAVYSPYSNVNGVPHMIRVASTTGGNPNNVIVNKPTQMTMPSPGFALGCQPRVDHPGDPGVIASEFLGQALQAVTPGASVEGTLYGCYCGSGSSCQGAVGTCTPTDALDAACRQHDIDYGSCSISDYYVGLLSAGGKTLGTPNTLACLSNIGPADQKLCETANYLVHGGYFAGTALKYLKNLDSFFCDHAKNLGFTPCPSGMKTVHDPNNPSTVGCASYCPSGTTFNPNTGQCSSCSGTSPNACLNYDSATKSFSSFCTNLQTDTQNCGKCGNPLPNSFSGPDPGYAWIPGIEEQWLTVTYLCVNGFVQSCTTHENLITGFTSGPFPSPPC